MSEDDTPVWPHYPDHREPAQHPQGERAPIPVSRTPWEHADSLEMLLRQVRILRRNRRDWWQDATWPEYEASLHRYLWLLFTEDKIEPLPPDLWDDLAWVRHYLHLRPLHRD